jgi:hypothetical protein
MNANIPSKQSPSGEDGDKSAQNVEAIPFPLGASNASRWVFAFLVLGLVVCLVRYLLRFPLTGDESRRAANLVGASYVQLTHPLRFEQVAPIPFLWIQLFVTRIMGFNEFSLRLIPILSSLASLGLFVHVSRRVLSGAAWVLAVGIFAVSHCLIRYSNEAKPYSLDLFVALVLIALEPVMHFSREVF